MNDNNFQNENDYSYHAVMDVKSKNRGFAISSMILGILSIVCCCYFYVGMAAAVLAIIFSVISRIKMGYFDGFAVAGLVTGIIGLVFGIAMIVVEILFVEVINVYIQENYPDIYTQIA